jgi:hypothetical protein
MESGGQDRFHHTPLKMKKTLKRIAPLQFGKVLGAVYGLISLIFVPFGVLFAILGAMIPSTSHEGPSPLIAIGIGLVMAVILPIFYAVMGFLFGVVGAWGYNVISALVGGIEVEVE